jgi:hypothetical protein
MKCGISIAIQTVKNGGPVPKREAMSADVNGAQRRLGARDNQVPCVPLMGNEDRLAPCQLR